MQNGTTNVQTPAPAPATTPQPAGATTGLLGKLQPSPWLLQKLIMLAVLVGVGVGAFCWGRRGTVEANVAGIDDPTESGKRVVAYLYNGKVPVTRAELGEYLIDRFGVERIEFMLNRKIVDMECKKLGITVSNGEVEHRLLQDIRTLNPNLTVQEFTNSILRRWNKTLYEYKEDVIRPKLMMEKLVRASVKISESDVREGYEARFGPKVDCRMIVFEKGQGSIAQKSWEIARKGRFEFLDEAKKCFIPTLAQAEGKVPPIHKHFGDKQLEDVAFRLKPGEVSGVMQMKDDTYVILLCEAQLPANLTIRYEDVRTELAKEVYEMKVAQRIPEEFQRMRLNANPSVVLDNSGTPSSNVMGAPVGAVREPAAPSPATEPLKGAPVIDKNSLPSLGAPPEIKSMPPVIPVPMPTGPLTTGVVPPEQKK